MIPHTQFSPFTPDPSWYETYWLEAPTKPRKAPSRRLPMVIAAVVGEWLHAHMAAAAQARRHRISLDEI
jgi:hypothetical protein